MDPRTQELISLLDTRFGYTGDNNRDLLGDTTFLMGEVAEELTVQWAHQYLTAHLLRCGEATDVACWGP